jgi:hypothetical protein
MNALPGRGKGRSSMDDWHSEEPATSDDEVRRRHEQNRIAWNDGAAAYTRDNA